MKKVLLIIGGIGIAGTTLFVGSILLDKDAIEAQRQTRTTPTAQVSKTIEKTEGELPEEFMSDIAFISQAPLLDWSWPFKTACEETSLLMAHKYLTGEAITPEQSQKEILAIVEFEKNQYASTSLKSAAAQISRLAQDYYGFNAETYYDITLEDIKREMVKGNLVLVPTAGRELQNPYFKTPGPIYHMFIMKGYTKDAFIVNEPGTKYGADFVYTNEILERAIRDVAMEDWDTPLFITDRTAMVVISPTQ